MHISIMHIFTHSNLSQQTFDNNIIGITCIQMILQWLRESNNDNEDKEHMNADDEEIHSLSKAAIADCLRLEKNRLIEHIATESIWTIDLVMLLQHIISKETEENSSTNEQYTFSYLFCSTKFGVDKTYNNIGYYKDAFTSDEIRVNKLFEIAEKQDLPLLETSTNLTLQVLVNVVSRKGVVAIVLLDNRILKNDCNEVSTYCGHYVVLCGISRDEKDIRSAAQLKASVKEEEVQNDDLLYDFCLVLKNPGIYKQVEYVSPCVFDKARKAKGTDQDVIFIAKDDNII